MVDKEIIKQPFPRQKNKKVLEPIITISKQDSVANRRRAFDKLRCKDSVGKLFNVIGPSSIDRPGGYLRVIKAVLDQVIKQILLYRVG